MLSVEYIMCQGVQTLLNAKSTSFGSESVTDWIPAGIREPWADRIRICTEFQRILSEV